MIIKKSFARLSLNHIRNSQLLRKASCLVIAEHEDNKIKAGTLAAIKAASEIGGTIDLMIVGKNLGDLKTRAASVSNIQKVLVFDHEKLEHPTAENLSKVVVQISKSYSHILAPSSNFGKNYIPRAAALMGCSPLTDIIKVIDTETFQRPIYAGNAIATIKMTDSIKFLLVRSTAFEKVAETGGSSAVEDITFNGEFSSQSTFIKANQTKSERPDLTTARVVVSGGRGMKNGENFTMLEGLADKLGGGAVGASRAAVDAGFVPNEYQVGQTGKVVAPELYVAVGISGAIQHLSGMKDSKTIVAINKDKDAPIFQVADYGIVDDLFKVVPEFTSKL